jgi:hypothetical protein
VPAASTPIVFTKAAFPTTTHLIDFEAALPEVRPTDPWAGKPIGIQILATTQDPQVAAGGGYWDLDNVRLAVTTERVIVPNGSFEAPATSFVDTRIEAWQKTPKPDFYNEEQNGPWTQVTGVFANTASGAADHIDNMDGNQALFLFNAPAAGIFLDFNSVDSFGNSNLFRARFEPGQAYRLAVGLIGGGGNMPEGATLQLGVYYLNSSNQPVTVASTNIPYSKAVFTSTTHFVDFSLDIPEVQPGDAWSGKYMGIQISSTTFNPQLAGGYWDVDHVRVNILPQTSGPFLNITRTGADLRLSWNSAVGFQYQLRASDDLQTWTNLDAPVPGTGSEISKTVSTNGKARVFYSLIATPVP